MPVTFSIHYKVAAMGASANDIKKDRALHPIYEAAGSTALDAWVLAIPRDGEVEGGTAGVLPGSLGRVCMPFVRCGDDLVDVSVGANGFIKASAWERFLSTIATIHGGDGAKPITLGGLLEDIDAKFSHATPAQLDDLTLRRADVEASIPVVAKPATPAAGADAAALLLYGQELANWEGNDKHPYAWLGALTFGDLRDESTVFPTHGSARSISSRCWISSRRARSGAQAKSPSVRMRPMRAATSAQRPKPAVPLISHPPTSRTPTMARTPLRRVVASMKRSRSSSWRPADFEIARISLMRARERAS